MSQIESEKSPTALPETFISSTEDLTRCCEHLQDCGLLGLDTEFVGEENYYPDLCLIQVATEQHLFVIDPTTIDSLTPFWEIIGDPKHIVVVHAGREEARFCQLATGTAPGNLFDVQIAAGFVGLGYPLSHTKLVNAALSIRLGKAETLTEWRNRPLSEEQLRYALDDVRFLLPLWKLLNNKLQELNRETWAAEEFARVAEQIISTEDAVTVEENKWRKLRGAGSLDSRRLAVLCELYRWREQTAIREDRPVRRILRDDLLVEIARRNPHRINELKVVRGLAKRYLDGLMSAIKTARKLPKHDWPKTIDKQQDPNQLALVAQVLTAFLGHWCVEQKLAVGLAATTNELKALIRAKHAGKSLPEDSSLTTGWRGEHVLPVLEAMLNGDTGLRVGSLQAAAPFEILSCLDSVS